MNFWNINHTKERLAILQKTQAQKRHLISIIKMKSTLQGVSTPKKIRNMNNSIQSRSAISDKKQYLSHSSQKRHSPAKKFHNMHIAASSCTKYKTTSPSKYQLKKANEKIVRTIINTDKLAAIKIKDDRKFIKLTNSLSRNHSAISNIKQRAKQKQIDFQNSKIFSRLIQASPTIKRKNWMKDNANTLKYRQNLNRCKYIRPDYSIEACKLLKYKMKQNQDSSLKKQNSLNSIKRYNFQFRNSMSALQGPNLSIYKNRMIRA